VKVYDQRLYVKTLSEFAGVLVSPYEVHTALETLTDRVRDVLDLAGSGVSLARGDRLEFSTAFGSAVAEIERTQERTQVGPCVTAFRSGQTIAVPDLTREHDRWPDYAATAARANIAAVASLPMKLGEQTVGALNLYARGTRDWSEEDLAAAQVMADMATVYLINADRLHQQVALNTQLQIALDSRIVIEQAKGALAAKDQITPDAAFERLRSHARSRRAPIRSVAEDVVANRLEI
jgi:GAF domain-containing protein